MGPADVKELHKALARDSSRVLATKVFVGPSGTSNWEKARVDAEFEFEMFPKNRAEGEMGLRGRSGQRVSVLSLFGPDVPTKSTGSRYWVSWYELWRKSGPTAFRLLTASWTVYRGITSYHDKMQLVRADWDQLCNRAGSPDAGQPHWHLDQPIPLGPHPVGRALPGTLQEYPPIQVGAGVAEAGPAAGGEIDHVHLAMGTWREREPNPACWQRDARNWRDVSDWAAKTLEYLQGQFRRR